MSQIHLQSIGKVSAVPASELKAGDVRMYNFGSTGLIVKVIEKTPKTLQYIIFEGGKYWMSDIRKDTLVAIVKRDQDVSEHKPTEAHSVGRVKGMVDVSEHFKDETVEVEEVQVNENNETEVYEMKTLIFEGAGWDKAESSILSGVGNCRIRTRIRNNEGRVIYLEMGGFEKSSNDKREILKGLRFVGRVDHCFYADSKWDSNRSHSEGLRNIERAGHFEYSQENILKFVNENLNCSFDSMEVINDSSVRVHDTEDPLCDCSIGDYVPYKDKEVNISALEEVKPLQEFPKHRMAQYRISYDYVRQHKSLKKWIEERQQREQDQFPNYTYYVGLRWDEKGIITSAEITSRQNFCTMGIGHESLESVIGDALECGTVDYSRLVTV